MHTAIFHSVNSGLYFWDGENGLLVDGIHNGVEEGCSDMPEFLAVQLQNGCGLFSHLTGVLFTHLHHDHYDARRVRSLVQQRPELPVYGPGLKCDPVRIRPAGQKAWVIRMGSASIFARDTVHDGARFQRDPHQSYLLRMGEEHFFIAGDADLGAEDATAFYEASGGRVNGGFFNLYQLVSSRGQEFVRQLRPERVFLEHLPFKKDDRFHYHRLARQASKGTPGDLPCVEILPHMAGVDGKTALWTSDGKGDCADDLPRVAQHGSLL